MERYLCIHGHFYQPPRENPWLEAVELQDSAYPFHDWNERIMEECYAANATSRILEGNGHILSITNNYAQISFNFGPTLLAWLADKAPDVYQAILAADRQSQEYYHGHGSALAQAYNHMILPLANPQDKRTQIHWGKRDFEHRFGRAPEGMWLPETAVDLTTLELLAEMGISFTLLAPNQARRVRPLGSKAWSHITPGQIDPTMPYSVRLPSGRSLSLFFYDGPISQAVAFENLLASGETFAHRLTSHYTPDDSQPPLIHIATDGETYGHHHRHGDMALAYALQYIETHQLARLTNYGEFLELVPPTHEVEIWENSSWSCAHGVERWWRDCGCNSGLHPGWYQAWRTPLRNALDWLRDSLAVKYVDTASRFLRDPWEARNDYIEVVLDRSPDNIAAFFQRHAVRFLTDMECTNVLKLLELQRHLMLMYTSCGWFFDDISGIETIQILQYAGRAIQLAQELFHDLHLEAQFLARLELAHSNLPEHRDGRLIYEKFVRPAMVSLLDVGAHYAISSLFEDYAPETRISCFTVQRQDYMPAEVGKVKLAVGRAQVVSDITGESANISFGVLHLGDHNLVAGVREFRGEDFFRATAEDILTVFQKADFPETIRAFDRHFGASTYSLKSLFRDEQRKVLAQIMETALAEDEAAYRQMYYNQQPLMRYLRELNVPLPRSFRNAADSFLNYNLRQAFSGENFDVVPALLTEAQMWQVHLDEAGLAYALKCSLGRLADELAHRSEDLALWQQLETGVGLALSLPFEVDLRRVQNSFYHILTTTFPEGLHALPSAEPTERDIQEAFFRLGNMLSIVLN